jgi:hypothetical protein
MELLDAVLLELPFAVERWKQQGVCGRGGDRESHVDVAVDELP